MLLFSNPGAAKEVTEMTILGKQIRMERVMDRNSGRTLIVPLDHGVTVGPIYGISDIKKTVGSVAEGGATAIVEHKGLVGAGHRRQGGDIGLIIHLSASTSLSPTPHSKALVCSVEEAIKLGADAVSIHVNIGDSQESEMLKDFGRVSYEARNWGIPLLAMVYPRGEKIEDEYDVSVVKHAARLGCEMGADLVKVSYTGSIESFREVVEGCTVPVVIAGGARMDSDEGILEMVKGSIEAGGAGVSIGRNVFQHDEPTRMVRAMAHIVFENGSVADAMKML
jgi:class I fructose-bisphosphate aldolase